MGIVEMYNNSLFYPLELELVEIGLDLAP